jgi:transcriptional regulator with XRE-family HTH domain
MANIPLQANHDKAIATRLSMFRKQFVHKSQNQAAKMLGLTQSYLSYMENAKLPIRLEFVAKLVKEYGLNQEWLSHGKGEPKDKNPPKDNLITDINAINEELALLHKQIRMMESNHNYLLKIIERLEKKIDQKS